MLTLNINYDVLPDRVVTIKLPESVSLGRHTLLLVLDEVEVGKTSVNSDIKSIMQLAGTVAAFDRIDAVEYQRKIRSEWN